MDSLLIKRLSMYELGSCHIRWTRENHKTVCNNKQWYHLSYVFYVFMSPMKNEWSSITNGMRIKILIQKRPNKKILKSWPKTARLG